MHRRAIILLLISLVAVDTFAQGVTVRRRFRLMGGGEGGGGPVAIESEATPLQVPAAAETHDMSITSGADGRFIVTVVTRTATVGSVALDPAGANTPFTLIRKLTSSTGSRQSEAWELVGVGAGAHTVRIDMSGQSRTLIATCQNFTNVTASSFVEEDNPADFDFSNTTADGYYVLSIGALADGETDPAAASGSTLEALGFHTDEATWGIMVSRAATGTPTATGFTGSNEGGGVLHIILEN